MIIGFRKKRKAFLSEDIYRQEANLFRMVGAEPYAEPQMDVYGFGLMPRCS
jgi:hypothetical protein